MAKSRDTDHGVKYVGDALRANSSLVWTKLSDSKTTFYLCGAAKTMAKNALDALIDGEYALQRSKYL